ncbi:chemotaxis protein CheD [Pseudacidovorax intermedius]|nr:chemotaxis protein CheD [Pseudacidovorax intermedius]
MSLSPQPMDIFLQPGEWFVGDATLRLRTMLGSCVAITLWHPKRQVGAMCHFLLGERRRIARGGEELDGRYGDEALALMVQGLKRERVPAAECEAKIFGGGNMFPSRTAKGGAHPIGMQNGHAAREMLAGMGIPVRREHLFGEGHRQVIFDIASGSVWVRQIPPSVS